jgi:transcriptional regulator GlxA family with amidase domain
VTACIDLALAMVEKDLGAEIARAVARKMVVYQNSMQNPIVCVARLWPEKWHL